MLLDFFTLIFDGMLFTLYAFIGFILFMAIQGIVYWSTGFSIYNWILTKLEMN